MKWFEARVLALIKLQVRLLIIQINARASSRSATPKPTANGHASAADMRQRPATAQGASRPILPEREIDVSTPEQRELVSSLTLQFGSACVVCRVTAWAVGPEAAVESRAAAHPSRVLLSGGKG